jgi:hypothetical protein
VEWSRENDVCIYMMCLQSLSPMGMWVLHKYALLVLTVACVLFWVKMGYFEFLILWYDLEYYASMHC